MKYTYCVYVLQLGDDQKHVYVGQTYLTPEERFKQHNTGYKSAPSIRKYKLSLRPDIYKQLPRFDTRQEALDVEERLAKNLAQIGYSVKGGH